MSRSAKPHTLMKKEKCLWRDAPDLVNKLPTVLLNVPFTQLQFKSQKNLSLSQQKNNNTHKKKKKRICP